MADTRLYFFRKRMPMSLKKLIIGLRYQIFRLPYTLVYKFNSLTNTGRMKNINQLPAPIRPQVIWIPLEKVMFQGLINHKNGRLALTGDWDEEDIYPFTSIFEEVPKSYRCWDVHETMRMLFIKGTHYRESPQYRSMMKDLKEKSLHVSKGFNSVADVDTYFTQLRGAFSSMQKVGYLSQKEQGKPNEWEIEIFVTRHGQLCIGKSGNHRIRMAQLLNIKTIPVIFKGIHPDWISNLCHQFQLPPRKAVSEWIANEFHSQPVRELLL